MKSSHAAAIAGIWLLFLFYLIASAGTPMCFSDCGGYVYLMGKNPFTADYWARFFEPGSRPWFIPFFYSIFGKYSLATALKLTILQTAIAFICWIYISYEASRLFTYKGLAFCMFLTLSFGQQYYLFNKYLLSDSLALSSVCLLIALAIRFTRTQKLLPRSVAISLLACAICLGTRDSNKIIVAAALFAIFVSGYKGGYKINASIFVACGILMILLQAPFAKERQKQNMANVLSGHVLPSEPASEFFLRHGMPRALSDKSKEFEFQEYHSVDIQKMAGYRDIVLRSEQGFLKSAGSIYVLYMLDNFDYYIISAFKNRDLILGQRWNKNSLGGYGSLGYEVFWPDPGIKLPPISMKGLSISPADAVGTDLKLAVAAIVVILALFFKCKKILIFAAVGVVGLGTAVISFYMDLWELGEMVRHAFIGAVLFNFGFLGMVLAAIAQFSGRINKAKLL
jgi:hypothetical protein